MYKRVVAVVFNINLWICEVSHIVEAQHELVTCVEARRDVLLVKLRSVESAF